MNNNDLKLEMDIFTEKIAISLHALKKFLCYTVDGSWNKWGDFEDCNKTCGGGHRTRTRECSNPRPKNGGKKCFLENTAYDGYTESETEDCNTHPCPTSIPKINRLQYSNYAINLYTYKYAACTDI